MKARQIAIVLAVTGFCLGVSSCVHGQVAPATRTLANVTDTSDAGIPSAFVGPLEPLQPAAFSIDHDLAATDWILERMADPDTVTDAEAVYLQKRYSHYAQTRDLCKRRVRLTLQVLSQGAAEHFQTREVLYSSSNGVPQVLIARVISPDGTVKNVAPADILTAGVEDDETDVTDAGRLVVPFPGLSAGDVLDLVYDVDRTNILDGGWSLRHRFGDQLPVREEILEMRVAEGVTVDICRAAWSDSGSHIVDHETQTHRWTLSDQEPLKWPVFCADTRQLDTWIGFSTYTSWSQAGAIYGDAFWPQAERTDSIGELARELTEGLTEISEHVSAIYAHVAENIGNVAIERDRGRLIPTPAAEVLRRGFGDCKDKVTLVIALCEAVGVDAQPALVSTRTRSVIRDDFVELGGFTHMVAFFPGVEGGTFCDPTLGRTCPHALPVSMAGNLSLVIPRDGEAELVAIPAPSAAEHGFDMVVDIRPLGDGKADIHIVGTYRGTLADHIERALSLADTTYTGLMVDRALAYGLWNTCQRISWQIERNGCSGVTLVADYKDTDWDMDQATSVTFSFRTEVADPFLSFPSAEDLDTDAELPHPYRNHTILRFHDSEDWKASNMIHPFAVEGPFYAGTIESSQEERDGDRFVEVRQTFEVRRCEIPIEEYREFRDDWGRFLIAVHQPYRYHCRIDEERIAELLAYVEDHPDDYGFMIRVVQQVLGADLGGVGEYGAKRRAIARQILEPMTEKEEAGAMPLLVLAALEAQEGRYYCADSLASIAVEREESNTFAIMASLGYKQEVRNLDGEITLMRMLSSSLGTKEIQIGLASSLYAKGLDEEAQALEQSTYMLHRDQDSTAVLLARHDGFVRSERYEEARLVLPLIEGDVSESLLRAMRAGILIGLERFAEAADTLETVYRDNPGDPTVCNNLAWAYAMAGRDLDRAEDLVKTAIIITRDTSKYRNTLGVVYLRQGNVERAQEIFEELLETDDRPETQTVNGYFLGFCEYQRGNKERAIEIWSRVSTLNGREKWMRRIRENLQNAEDGALIAQISLPPEG